MPDSLLSVQLYTVRELLAEDLSGTLGRIADIGFTQAEPYALHTFGPELAEGLAAAGLRTPTAHAHYIGEDATAVFEAARALGVEVIIDPFVGPERWGTRESVEQIARELNEASRAARNVGVTVGYHNHSHELVSVIDGRTALEVFADALDDDVVLELDTYWAAAGGVDPVSLLGRLGDRVVAIHVKDGPPSLEPLDQVAVGHGNLPIRAIVEAAPGALRVIELDDSRGDRFQAVADSYTFLTSQGLV